MTSNLQASPQSPIYGRLTDLLAVPPKNGLYKQQECYGSGIRMVHMTELFANRILTSEDMPRVTLTDDEVRSFSALPGDILIARRSIKLEGVAKAVLIGQISEPLTFESSIIRLRPNAQKIHSEFLLVFLESEEGRRQVTRVTRQVAVSGIAGSDLRQISVPIFPISEQRRIAQILRAWDEAIGTLDKMINVKRRHVAAVARAFFEPCHPSVREKPSSWREFTLGTVFRERAASGSNSDALLSITMAEGVIDREDVGRRDTSNVDKSNYKLILPGDIGYNTMRMWQGVSGLSKMRGIVSPAYTVVTPDNKNISGRYAAHLFKSRRMVFDFERYSQGLTSDTWNLKFPAFSKIPLFLPPIRIQEQQADLLDAMKGELDLLGKQREMLDREKRGLMQKLLTGEWRVKAAAREAAA